MEKALLLGGYREGESKSLKELNEYLDHGWKVKMVVPQAVSTTGEQYGERWGGFLVIIYKD